MAKRANGTTQPPAEETFSSTEIGKSNCSDETRRDYYRKALIAKIAHEAALAGAKTKNAEYRNVLKEAKKHGVDSAAIAATLADRFTDEDVLVLELRERLKMLDLSGTVPDILNKILARYAIEEPTKNEREQITLDRAYDGGAFDGREGKPRDGNPYIAGTDEYDAHDRGWLLAQAAIAHEMAPKPPAALQPADVQ